MDPAPVAAENDQRVQVAEQSLTYRLVPLQGWQLQARYRYVNPHAAAITLSTELTSQPCPSTSDCGPRAGELSDIVVLLDGELVEGPASGARSLEIPIPAGASRELRVSMAFDASDGIDFAALQHLMPPPGSIAGPVGRFQLDLWLPRPVWYVSWNAPLSVEGPRRVPGGGGSAMELSLTATDLVPQELIIGMPGSAIAASSEHGLCVGWEGELPTAQLDAELATWSRARLEACRDHLLALHGAVPRPRYAGNPLPLPPGATAHVVRPLGEVDRGTLAPGERAWLAAVEARIRSFAGE